MLILSRWRLDLDEAGFTLIELLIVMLILGILFGIATWQYNGQIEVAKVSATKRELNELQKAMDLYQNDYSSYPQVSNAIGLKHDLDPAYIWNMNLYDPWGTEYIVNSNTSNYLIKSYGRDKVDGGSGMDADLYVPGGLNQ